VELVLAAFAVTIGALLISWSVLLYPTEERSISDALAAWWIRIDDASKATNVHSKMLIQTVAAALVRWLDDVFGEQLVSRRALAVSTCLSFSSIAAIFGLVALVDPTPDPANPKIAVVCLPASVLLFQVAVSRKSRYLRALVSLTIGLIVSAIVIAALLYSPFPLRILALPAGLLLGLTSAWVIVMFARQLAKSAATSFSTLPATSIAIGSGLVGVTLLCMPAVSIYNGVQGFEVVSRWEFVGAIAGLTNLYAGAMAFTLLAVNVMFLLQKALWPVIARPLYAMERFGLFRQRRALFYCGAMLMAFAFPSMARVLLKAVDLF
jgi:hypothetical protein